MNLGCKLFHLSLSHNYYNTSFSASSRFVRSSEFFKKQIMDNLFRPYRMLWQSQNADEGELVAELQEDGCLSSQDVIDAMKATDRKIYCKHDPYADEPQTIGFSATISAPHMHATALELLKDHIKEDSHILDVGSGSGYLTTCFARYLLAKFGKTASGYVVGIEKVPELVEKSVKNIKNDDASLLDTGKVVIVEGDGRLGCPEHAPFDVIHVGAASPATPQELIEQLNPGGRMIVPVGPEDDTQHLMQFDKDAHGKVHKKRLMAVMFVPLTD